ncbi:MAG: CHAT domain-containing protein, partial [Phormidesmis sp.]
MSKTVVINLGRGSLTEGFSYITARLWSDTQPRAEQFVGALPPAPEMVEVYRIWQSTYRALSDRRVLRLPPESKLEDGLEIDGLEIDSGGVTQVSQQSFEELSHQLKREINRWLSSEELLPIERQLRSHLNPTDSIRVIFETDSELLLRLPWNCWNFFQDYPKAEMAIAQPQYKRPEAVRENRKQVRILAIVGGGKGIDTEPERQLLQSIPDVEAVFLVAPSRQIFDQQLWDKAGWDILFFAGHSQSEGETGRLYINEESSGNSLTIEQLEKGLKGAIAQGLQLAIFNSCDGIGLARAIGQLQIPQVIVMREPVPNRVAQLFLQHFLRAFASEKLSLYQAVRQARDRLQGLENEFPGASWLPVLCQNPAVEPSTWFQLGGKPACPYRGLAAFKAADAHLFFGREQSTANLLAAVVQQPFVAVVGPSGSGKSSIVFAGLLPQMQQKGWQTIACRPGSHPFDNLAEALLTEKLKAEKLEPEDSQTLRLKVLELAVSLQQDNQGLGSALVQRSGRHLLIIDQFEELYTLCSLEDRALFIDLLLTAVQSAPEFTLLLTLRADFYGEALSDRRLSDALQAGIYNLGPMQSEELKRAIAQPAAKVRVTLEPGLTELLIQSTWEQAGRLPMLEFTLAELWEQQSNGRLTHQAYQAIGGIEKALANHAEASYAQFSSDDQKRMQRIFMQLIEPGAGNRATRRLASQEDVGDLNWGLVAKLASARLVTTSYSLMTEKETVEIIHEALIQRWGRLAYWLQIDGEFRRWQEDLRRARSQWVKDEREEAALLRGKQLTDAQNWYDARLDELSEKDRAFVEQSVAAREKIEQQQKRRRRLTVGALSLGLLATSSLMAIAGWNAQRAQLSEVSAIATTSEALFLSNQHLDSLVAALKAQHGLKMLLGSNRETKTNVETVLRQAVSKIDEKNRLIGHTAGTTAAVFSPSGQFIASASQDGTVRLWQPGGTLLKILEGHRSEIWGLAISPNNQTIASASDDKTIRLWRTDGTAIATLTGHRSAVNAVAFSSNGEHIASAGEDGEVRLWQSDGTGIKTFQAHEEKIDAIAFSPNRQLIATGSGDTTIKLWNAKGDLKATLKGHTGTVRGIAFSPDGLALASASA